MKDEVNEMLAAYYDRAMNEASGQERPTTSPASKKSLDILVAYSENAKAVITVVLTSIVYKILHPEQDIRRHQASIEGGYAGRPFDGKYITPFMKEHKFPAMSESGWLTRSLEQKVPYDKNYTGAIKPSDLKEAFLDTLDYIERHPEGCPETLDYLLQGLIIQRDKGQFSLATPQNLPINIIVGLLDNHFHHKYNAKGASRLPVLAIYAVYQSLIREVKRYEGKTLLPLENHTSADAQSGRMGDIDIINSDGTPFEAVEVKFDIPISHNIIVVAKEKILPTAINRYYVLSTAGIVDDDKKTIEGETQQIKNVHGCQLIVNGIMPSLKYYLRLLDDPRTFTAAYTRLLAEDKAVKYEHKEVWNRLVAEL